MVYSNFAHYSKEAAHWTIDNTFPNSASIASATAFVSWYSYQVGMTYSQAPLTAIIVEKMGYPGYAVAPLIVPWLSPIVSSHFSIATSCLTSLTLNLIAKKVFATNPEMILNDKQMSLLKKTPQNTVSNLMALSSSNHEGKKLTASIDPPLNKINETPFSVGNIDETADQTPVDSEEKEVESESDDPMPKIECCWKICK